MAANPLFKSFEYAFSGIITGLKTERNMMIHYSALGLVVVFGITLKLSVTEWCICLILCALVISLELVNTAVEAVVDLVTKEQRRRAKLAKDTAAGAVLIAAITAAVIGGIIFIPKILALFALN
ncbi:diacylglycerol kinase family protein [Extibacter muris]|uniref:diacylglycerol kinase family protein n=1 Tax=Extibacter muris TaxID=1796622 RepID=UPI001D05F3A7|nr:diacylglycerol kinase family protein [Extibacter muris]MCB6200866.1 diacylglycerol kinase family protein [Extibacter muris]MCQ4662196.1 diacylglycerol kinase family protein [Extibacter muris]MCQ4691890.1 diacylglycerol kinase family protein [Extibacter muris]